MKIRLALAALVAAIGTTLVIVPGVAAAQPTAQAISIPITPAQSGGVLNGVFQLTSFSINSAGQLVANGVFTGTATIGGVTQTITSTVSAVLQVPAGPCRILDLTLGPLHLDLLGLVVDLNQVHLTITAQPGPGNLLGNLLCAVAHLLDNTNASNNALQNLVNLLNQLLAGL